MARVGQAIITEGGQEYNWTKGGKVGNTDDYIVTVNGTKYTVPYSDRYGFSQSTASKLIQATVDKGGPLTGSEVAQLTGYTTRGSEYFAWYQATLDENKDKFGYSSAVYLDDNGDPLKEPNAKYVTETGEISPDYGKPNNTYDDMVEAAYQDRLNLMTDPTGVGAQRFRDTMYGAIAQEQAVAEQSLGQAELDAYRMLGQQQLELENTIAEQRKRALISGTTSAQLAAGQLQNMFAAQSGAAQVAQSLANQRTQLNQAYAEKRTGVETSLYDYINQQQTIAATAGAQNLAALASYYSYANKNENDMMSLYRAKQQLNTSAYNQLLEDMGYKEK